MKGSWLLRSKHWVFLRVGGEGNEFNRCKLNFRNSLYYSWNCNNNREMASLTFKRSVIHRNRVKFCSFIAMNSYWSFRRKQFRIANRYGAFTKKNPPIIPYPSIWAGRGIVWTLISSSISPLHFWVAWKTNWGIQ